MRKRRMSCAPVLSTEMKVPCEAGRVWRRYPGERKRPEEIRGDGITYRL